MRKRNHFLIVSILVVSMILFTSALDSQAKAAGKATVWKFFSPYPPAMMPAMKAYTAMIKKATNGRLDVKVFFFGEHPYKGQEILSAVRDNMAQMGHIVTGYYAGTEPALSLTGGPLVASSQEEMFKMHEALTETGIFPAIYKKYNALEVGRMCWWGPTIACRDTLVTSFDSLKGKKIRGGNKEYCDMIRMFGGTPVTLAWGEVYTALQRGIIDGATGSFVAQRDSKWPEVVKFMSRWAEAFGLETFVVNRGAFNKLPSDLQKTYVKVTKEFETMVMERMASQDALAAIDVMHNYGVTVNAVPRNIWKGIQAQAPAYLEEQSKKRGKGAPEALEVIKKVRGW